ncbi:methyl-accepting chemotaxis protein [Salinirubrum litoreum]|uniref:Methyl-accepting chemotaxis protein n=1 Tax=Salinirubrum litoreum TaxID=1126234 RepID=A0ABD5RCH3_9EURY
MSDDVHVGEHGASEGTGGDPREGDADDASTAPDDVSSRVHVGEAAVARAQRERSGDAGHEAGDTNDRPADSPAPPTARAGMTVAEGTILDGVGAPIFMLDAGHEVIAWNHGLEQLTGVPAEEALGSTHASEAFYPDGRRAKTLADKVLDEPEAAHESYDITLEDSDLPLYGDTSTMLDRHGTERHISFTAMPIRDAGQVVGVVETVHDRTEDVRRHRAISELVDELQTTIRRLVGGELATRAEFTGDREAVDDGLLSVVDELNEMAEQFEQLTGRVDRKTAALDAAVQRAVEAAARIDRHVEAQNDLLDEGATEMQSFSASMEEVAATADQVNAAAEGASEAAADGLDASEDAREVTDEVIETSDDLVASVQHLGERMDDIESVVEVISEVAEQTNLLALNANIEAARAGEDGDGFAVVADEVKALAEETRTHTEEITDRIAELQAEADRTVDATEQSHERIEHAGERITTVLEAFDAIAESIDEAARGVVEVSRATDDQAATVEDLTATIETVQGYAEKTETATDEIVAATDAQSDAIDELGESVADLRGNDEVGATVEADGGIVSGEREAGTSGETGFVPADPVDPE